MLARCHRQSLFGCFSCVSNILLAGPSSCRTTANVRNASDGQVWKRAYLKDLYHRRVILGPDPLKSRAAEDNWNYPSEISALSHRLHVPEMDHELIVQALTDRSFFKTADHDQNDKEGRTEGTLEEEESIAKDSCNEALAEKGLSVFRHIILTYLRAHWPLAPEEFIVGIAARIASSSSLTELSNHLGLPHLVRASSDCPFPLPSSILHSALLALIGAMEVTNVRTFVRNFVLPRLHAVPMEDVLPFRHPFPVLRDYMLKLEGVTELEPRTVNCGGVLTASPFYEVAIYADSKTIIGQSGGERPWTALDLASQDGLLRLWGVTDKPRVFPFKFEEVYAKRFEKAQQPNHKLSDVCSENTDLSIYTHEELARDPLDLTAVTNQYFTQIRPEVGIPHRRRLRHAFSRGSFIRQTKRAFVKPTVQTI